MADHKQAGDGDPGQEAAEDDRSETETRQDQGLTGGEERDVDGQQQDGEPVAGGLKPGQAVTQCEHGQLRAGVRLLGATGLIRADRRIHVLHHRTHY